MACYDCSANAGIRGRKRAWKFCALFLIGKRRAMPRFILAILVLIVLLVAILVVAPGLVPVSAYKGRIESAASEALGRQVTVGDDLSLKIIPQTAFRVTDLEIANAEGFEGAYLARVKSADIGVKLFSLLSGSVEVERFVLTEPELNLAVAQDGAVNWNLANPSAETPTETSGGELRDLKLGDVRLVDGRASFSDAAAGKTYTVEDIDAAVRLKNLAEPLEVDGTMIFEGAPTKVDIVLTSLGAMMKKEPANLKMALTLGAAAAGADLVINSADELTYSGPINLTAPDLPAFAALLGAPLADAPGFDNLSVEGDAAGGPNGIRLSDAKIQFDKIDATGDLALAWGGARPKATGALAVGALDLRPYLPPPAEAPQGFPAWSEDKLDLASLRNIDADIDIAADKIFLNDMEFGESRMKLTINDGRMVADIPELGMYGGGGSGQLVVNAKGATPSFTGKFDLGSVQAEPFAKDVMKNDRLLGLGSFKLDFSASGSSQAAIMRSLDGSGGFELSNGALKGVNIAKLARAVGQIQQSGLNPTAIASAVAEAQKPTEQTDFSEMLSQFKITDGLVNAPTISLVGPFLTMAGTGSVNLPNQTLDLRLAPKATTTIDGVDGKAYTIPMRITGTFSQPKIGIDAEALLKGRVEQGLQNILSGIGKNKQTDGADADKENNKADPAKSLLEGIIGGAKPKSGEPARQGSGDEPAAATVAPTREEKAAEAINQLFGRKKTKEAEDQAEAEPQ